ncbi:Adenosine Receptor A1 [Manis pentadactyla]|nr:Adenosine Receptor A1 [Manis pentadactyla]
MTIHALNTSRGPSLPGKKAHRGGGTSLRLFPRFAQRMFGKYQGILPLEAAVTSPGSCPLLWLVKRNQVRLPERFGPLQPATAGLAMPSPWRSRRESPVAESTS